ncbi:MAG: ASCH domain-containing protein [Nanoarchaeota archaeon]|nr:ASCH domain-containing protein [Nanoarchaeota archaeon]MBU1028465.1 ASCH domain-containing protein [Nanoarchaeota archaeon]
MKALSLKQPWAELILQEKKTIEIRKWNTKFRGEFLIHASKTPDMNSMKRFGFKELPCGFIVGKANLVEVKKYPNKEEFDKDKDKHLATSGWGNHGFILKTIERLDKVPAKGQLGFWDFNSQ